MLSLPPGLSLEIFPVGQASPHRPHIWLVGSYPSLFSKRLYQKHFQIPCLFFWAVSSVALTTDLLFLCVFMLLFNC